MLMCTVLCTCCVFFFFFSWVIGQTAIQLGIATSSNAQMLLYIVYNHSLGRLGVLLMRFQLAVIRRYVFTSAPFLGGISTYVVLMTFTVCLCSFNIKDRNWTWSINIWDYLMAVWMLSRRWRFADCSLYKLCNWSLHRSLSKIDTPSENIHFFYSILRCGQKGLWNMYISEIFDL